MDRMGPESPLETKTYRIPTCTKEQVEVQLEKLKKIEKIVKIKHGVMFGWTYTAAGNAPLSFDPDLCPIEKVRNLVIKYFILVTLINVFVCKLISWLGEFGEQWTPIFPHILKTW